MKTNRKTHIFLEYSSLCNANPLCAHCQGAPFKYDSTLKRSNLEKIIAFALENDLSIALTGGDPTAYPAVARRLDASGVKYSILTHGLVTIEGIRPSLVHLSIDGDDLRPYDKSHVLENAISYGSPVVVTTCISRRVNLTEIYGNLVENSAHIKKWRISFLNKSGNADRNYEEIKPKYEEVFPILAGIIENHIKKPVFELAVKGVWFDKMLEINSCIKGISRLHNPCSTCHGQTAVSIEGSGSVTYCPLSRYEVGRVDDSPNKMLSASYATDMYFETYEKWSDCLSCRYFSLCGGGCPAKAQEQHGNWFGRDEIYCILMSNWEKYILPILPAEVGKALYESLNQRGKVFA